MIKKNVSIREDQAEWIKKQPRTFNLSKKTQNMLDKEMKR